MSNSIKNQVSTTSLTLKDTANAVATPDYFPLAQAYIEKLERSAGNEASEKYAQTFDSADPVASTFEDNEEPGAKGSLLRPDLIATAVLIAAAVHEESPLTRKLLQDQAIITLKVSDETILSHAVRVLETCALPIAKKRKLVRGRIARSTEDPLIIAVLSNSQSTKADEKNEDVADAIVAGASVIGISTDPDRLLPTSLTRVAESQLIVPDLDANTLEFVVSTVTGQPFSSSEHGGSCTNGIDDQVARRLSVSDLALAIRRDFSPEECAAKLIALVNKRNVHHDAPELASLYGYGDVKIWGMNCAADIKLLKHHELKWSETDHRGVLLSGPPGVGKTLFASALAKQADVPLVASSVAQWIATDHLGRAIEAMRKTFDEARRARPCILLLDEMDSISSRDTERGQNGGTYMTILTNALLECLAGAEALEGVVVVGCTNHSAAIDPAIKRAGRLDREFNIDFPDADALSSMFEQSLGSALSKDEFCRLGMMAEGATGADVASWCNRAKGAARRSGKRVSFEIVAGEICPPTLDIENSEVLLWSAAIHEAALAVAFAVLTSSNVRMVQIQTNGSGKTVYDPLKSVRPTVQYLKANVASLLAGAEAENLFLGCSDAGANSGPTSDLASATRLAITIATCFGTDEDEPIHIGHLSGEILLACPWLVEPVRKVLAECRKISRNFVEENQAAIEAIAENLMEKRVLTSIDLTNQLGALQCRSGKQARLLEGKAVPEVKPLASTSESHRRLK